MPCFLICLLFFFFSPPATPVTQLTSSPGRGGEGWLVVLGKRRHTPASPGAHSLGGIQVWELPPAWGGPLSPAPQPLVAADGDGGWQPRDRSAVNCWGGLRVGAWFHPAAFKSASALLNCPQFQPAASFSKALHLHYLPLEPSGPPT